MKEPKKEKSSVFSCVSMSPLPWCRIISYVLPNFLPVILPACLPSLCHSLHAHLPSLLPSLTDCLLPCFLIREGGITPSPLQNLELVAKDQSNTANLPELEVLGGITLRVIEFRKPVKALFSEWKFETSRLLCRPEFSVLAPSWVMIFITTFNCLLGYYIARW